MKGFRKTATAIANYSGTELIVNHIPVKDYFKDERLISMAIKPLQFVENKGIKVSVKGSGLSAQAQAVKHAVARLISMNDEVLKNMLKKLGLLIGDTRQVERKKPGQYKARKGYVFRRR